MTKVRLLEEQDIFDVYGVDALIGTAEVPGPNLARFDEKTVLDRISEIHAIYVSACKARIRSEARFCGVDLEGELSVSRMLEKVRDFISEAFNKQAETGQQVDLLSTILGAHSMAGTDMSDFDLGRVGMEAPPEVEKVPDPDVDPDWFTKQGDDRMWDNPKWNEIAKAYVKLEEATCPRDMVQAIDLLNSLQHNSFHLLIDLQTGRMLEDKSEGTNYGSHNTARLNLQFVLDLINKSSDVFKYIDRMSEDIRKLLVQYRGEVRSGR